MSRRVGEVLFSYGRAKFSSALEKNLNLFLLFCSQLSHFSLVLCTLLDVSHLSERMTCQKEFWPTKSSPVRNPRKQDPINRDPKTDSLLLARVNVEIQ